MNSKYKPRLVLLSQYFYPEENTTSWLMSQLGFSLANDYDLFALAGPLTYHEDDLQERVPARLREKGVQIIRVPSTRFARQSTLGRILNTFTFSLFVTSRLLALPHIDLIFAVTNPPLLHWVAAFVGRVRRIPVALLIHDQYPEIVVALGKMSKESKIIAVWKWLTRWSYRHAAVIISLGRCMTQLVQDSYGSDLGSKIVTIPNWDDGSKIRPMPRDDNSLLDEWGLRDKYVVLYAGNIGLFHEIATVVHAAELLLGSNVTFVFVGDGGQREWLEEEIKRRRLENIRVLPFRPKEEMPLVLTACDAALITLKGEATGLCVPSKLYGTLASGKPVLCVMDPASETALAVVEAECGEVVEPGDAEKLANVLRHWSTKSGTALEMGLNARRAFDARYSQPKIVARYKRALSTVSARGGSDA